MHVLIYFLVTAVLASRIAPADDLSVVVLGNETVTIDITSDSRAPPSIPTDDHPGNLVEILSLRYNFAIGGLASFCVAILVILGILSFY